MRLHIFWRRWRGAAGLTALRLCGLLLAVLLTAAVPVFVGGAMEQVLARTLAQGGATTAVVAWRAPAEGDYAAGIAGLERYLGELGAVERLLSTGPLALQRLDASGKLLAGRKYYRLGVLPSAGVQLAEGRLPESGEPEVVVPARAGYEVGTRLRLPLETQTEVTVVGTMAGTGGAMQAALDGAVLTGAQYWDSLGVPAGEAVWAVAPAGLHAAAVPALVDALARLPVRAQQFLPGAEVAESPLQPLAAFVAQMNTTRRFLYVLLTPVFLLLLFFISATAGALVESRKVEIAVLRSRGLAPWRTIAFYLPESAVLVLAAWAGALLLTPPVVRVMGLNAGFLQLVGRPPMPVSLTGETLLLALAAAVLAEAVALWPLARATGFTVVTLRQEAATRSPVLAVLRGAAEAALLLLVGYGTWRVRTAGVGPDLLLWALPPLALAGAAFLFLRSFEPLMRLVGRLLGPWLPPAAALAMSYLQRLPDRHRILALMLVLTTGLGVYGATFARTLDRDLAARTDYRVGADLSLRAVWETEVLEVAADGTPTVIAYREPPFGDLEGVPGAAALARVQTRRDVSLSAGTRNVGKVDLLGITPVEFGQVARFLPDLTPDPGAYLNALAADERAVLLSLDLARRIGAKMGDTLKARQWESEADLVVAGVIAYWPGRLPEQGEFAVGNLALLQDLLGLAPYDVWVRLAPGTDGATWVAGVQARGARLASALDAPSQLAAGRREPFRLGIYATLSTGFIVALLAMVLTYLLATGLTLQARAKELGVLRAMGMGRGQISLSLYIEQFAVAGAAALTGLGAGGLVAAWYVPIFRQQPGEVPLPTRLAGEPADWLTMLGALGLALLIGILMVPGQMRRLQIGTALRLGEDG